MRRVDLLVVGSGPAGAAAAASAAKTGVDVLMIEKNPGTGMRVRCGELVPALMIPECPEIQRFTIQKTAAMVTFFPPDQQVRTQAPGVIIDRPAFDRHMAEQATAAGTHLLLNARARDLRDGIVTIDHAGKTITVQPTVIIGADGPGSRTAAWIHARQTEFLLGLQVRTPLTRPMNDIEIHFRPELFGGYGWVFPRGDVANVGIGIRIRRGPREPDHTTTTIKLEAFVRRMADRGIITNHPTDWQAGLIPAGGPVKTMENNILLAGDAAGHTHPVTGGGIAHAVLIGRLAGKTAAEAITARDLSHLTRYEKRWRQRWGRELARAVQRRRHMETHWENLADTVRSCWVVFPDYYR